VKKEQYEESKRLSKESMDTLIEIKTKLVSTVDKKLIITPSFIMDKIKSHPQTFIPKGWVLHKSLIPKEEMVIPIEGFTENDRTLKEEIVWKIVVEVFRLENNGRLYPKYDKDGLWVMEHHRIEWMKEDERMN